MLTAESLDTSNAAGRDAHRRDLEHVGEQLDRRGLVLEDVLETLAAFEVAVPSWALGTGGTRFGRYPGGGEPRDVLEKMEDIAVIHQLTGATPTVSLHIPWDEPDDPAALLQHADELGLGFDAVNSNTFQDQAGQAHSYKFGSLSHTDAAVRDQAIAHNVHVLEVGKTLGSKAMTVWLADGSNYPGQMHLRKSFERVRDGLAADLRSAPRRLAAVHRAQAVRAGLLRDRCAGLGLVAAAGPGAR